MAGADPRLAVEVFRKSSGTNPTTICDNRSRRTAGEAVVKVVASTRADWRGITTDAVERSEDEDGFRPGLGFLVLLVAHVVGRTRSRAEGLTIPVVFCAWLVLGVGLAYSLRLA